LGLFLRFNLHVRCKNNALFTQKKKTPPPEQTPEITPFSWVLADLHSNLARWIIVEVSINPRREDLLLRSLDEIGKNLQSRDGLRRHFVSDVFGGVVQPKSIKGALKPWSVTVFAPEHRLHNSHGVQSVKSPGCGNTPSRGREEPHRASTTT
jgi:hypothetical protein